MLNVHGKTFSATKISSQVSLSSHGIHQDGDGLAVCIMSHDPETSAEKAEHRKNMLDDQRDMLQHIPAWLRYRGMTQRQAAERLGVKEASFSKWLAGVDAMKIGFLRQLATLLQAKDGDLVAAPPASGLAPAVAELMDAAEGLTMEQIAVLSATARMMTRKAD
jgi:transcriptional regulator with XRE-family HTH domain